MGGQENRRRKKKFSFLKCIPKSNVIKFLGGVLVFIIRIWYLAYPTDRSLVYIISFTLLQSPLQVDMKIAGMKNALRLCNDFVWYSNTLETYRDGVV